MPDSSLHFTLNVFPELFDPLRDDLGRHASKGQAHAVVPLPVYKEARSRRIVDTEFTDMLRHLRRVRR